MDQRTRTARRVPPLRVLVVAVNYAPEVTGTAPYTAGLAEGLRQRGHEVRVFTSFPHYPRWALPRNVPRSRTEELDGVVVERHRHYVPCEPDPLRRALYEVAFGLRVVARRWTRADVVVCISPALFSSLLTLVRGKVSPHRPALALVIQDMYSSGVAETGAGGKLVVRLMRLAESLAARSADGVAVVHQDFARAVREDLHVPASRVRVIRNWARLPKADHFDEGAFRAAMGWGREEVVVLHAGAEGRKQGLENVVRAAALADTRDEPVRFVLVGDGSQRPALERDARGVRALQFLDSLEDELLEKALAAADVLLVNERPEVTSMTVPSKLTSYFNAGKPVLAATAPASIAAEELSSARAGVRVDPAQPAALLDAALDLARHPRRSASLGLHGERYAHEVLSRSTAIDAYERWIHDLASGRAERRRRAP